MTGISAGGGLSYSSDTSLKLGYTSVASNYTINQVDFVIDCSANTFTVTLPTAAGISGKQFVIKNSGTGVITVDANGSETIDGYANFVLSTKGEAIWVVSDGANWKVI